MLLRRFFLLTVVHATGFQAPGSFAYACTAKVHGVESLNSVKCETNPPKVKCYAIEDGLALHFIQIQLDLVMLHHDDCHIYIGEEHV